ncbi:hypothetical protein ACFQ1M_06300 [Sungkyunkwania multivorans]|uniref:Uncharacterized protein n=1 Tax=Sungkyunkwania multivorans TaxID=1173618 RepID=A0ABW3CYR2_9FLAO
MKMKCQRCLDREFDVPDFSLEEKRTLTNLKANYQLAELLERIESIDNMPMLNAKFILLHINGTHGKCNRCGMDDLSGEYVVCPKCKALNFNWDIKEPNGH